LQQSVVSPFGFLLCCPFSVRFEDPVNRAILLRSPRSWSFRNLSPASYLSPSSKFPPIFRALEFPEPIFLTSVWTVCFWRRSADTPFQGYAHASLTWLFLSALYFPPPCTILNPACTSLFICAHTVFCIYLLLFFSSLDLILTPPNVGDTSLLENPSFLFFACDVDPASHLGDRFFSSVNLEGHLAPPVSSPPSDVPITFLGSRFPKSLSLAPSLNRGFSSSKFPPMDFEGLTFARQNPRPICDFRFAWLCSWAPF